MKFLDYTAPDPAANLALDEALLEHGEATGDESLRLWESPVPFVVLGAGSVATREVQVENCARLKVEVLRRCSGGGTVVQGPGCLNYNLVLDMETRDGMGTIDSTNRYVLSYVLDAVRNCGANDANLCGISDLASGGVKFSGNAQRRRKRFVLFHGTILYGFDLGLIATLLQEPEKQPDYRAKRPHSAFVQNLACDVEELKGALRRAWEANEDMPHPPVGRALELVQEKYSQHDWNWRM